MAETSFPFQSIGGDRSYGVANWVNVFISLFTDGVLLYENELDVVEDSGMDITMQSGSAFVQGQHYNNSSDLSITISPADATLDRIDRIVLRRSNTNRTITAEVLTGTPAASPAAPSLTQVAGGTYELCRALVYVAAAVTEITNADITSDLSNPNLCGISTLKLDLDSINTLLLASIEDIETELALVVAGGIPSHGSTHAQGESDAIDLSSEINEQSDSYTIALSDSGKLIKMTKATACDLTIPLYASVACPVGFETEVLQYGAGPVTIVATAGVTIRSAGGLTDIAAQNVSVGLKCIAEDEWLLTGYLA